MKYVLNTEKLDKIIRSYNELSVDLYYPIKVNSNRLVIDFLDSKVKGYEVDSLCHIKTLVEEHHVSSDRILYSYPLKTKKDIIQSIGFGVRRFVVDNAEECDFVVEFLSQLGGSIIIRVSISEVIEDITYWIDKWGVSFDKALLMKKKIQSAKCKFEGISFYLPQEINHAENVKKMIYAISEKIGLSDCSILDIGGGIDVETLKELLPLVSEKTNEKTKIIIEPGRHLVGPCIDMITEVLSIRVYGEKRVVYIDTGIYNGLLDAIIKKKRFNIVFENNTNYDTSNIVDCIICGKSSDISDNIGCYQLPSIIKSGDKLRIIGCGAYCSELETYFYSEHNPIYELIHEN